MCTKHSSIWKGVWPRLNYRTQLIFVYLHVHTTLLGELRYVFYQVKTTDNMLYMVGDCNFSLIYKLKGWLELQMWVYLGRSNILLRGMGSTLCAHHYRPPENTDRMLYPQYNITETIVFTSVSRYYLIDVFGIGSQNNYDFDHNGGKNL